MRTTATILLFLSVLVSSCLCVEAVSGESVPFRQAIEPRTLVFPQDHASHAGFQTEWWYVTGNLKDDSGHEFGYQFTIFRRTLEPGSAVERGRKSKWAVDDIYIGHLAISDITGKQFVFREESKRGVLGIAGATDAANAGSEPVRIYLSDWELRTADNGWSMKARSGGVEIDFSLEKTMQPVPHGRPGEEGLSRKGPKPGQASYYYSVPQLKTSGALTLNGKTFSVKGLSWMDHEFGSNQLSAQQAGWDWFAIQLDDGRALMIYILRNKDGTIEPTSSATWIEAGGKGTYVPLDGLKLTKQRTWKSPQTGGEYTLGWQIEIPSRNVLLTVDAAQDDQEIRGAKISNISYYEGAIRVRGRVGGKEVKGSGYLEITGAPGQKDGGERGLGGLL
ncbi:MAG TPA: lipocalin-like domain-containing protein [Planctomycetota bacterium]|nr:lipocalin-like domain-containing protein [Planctomycetota bacterium]